MLPTPEIGESREGEVLVLTPVGRIDSSVARDFEDFLSRRVAEGNKHIVVDFSTLTFISSAGMRVLLLTAKKIRVQKGSLYLCNMRDSIREIFSISGFDRIIRICATLVEALGQRRG